MKIIFMGTPDFGLKALDNLNKEYQVELVVCQPDRINRRGKKINFSPIKKYALEHNLELYQPENINSDESIEKISSINADFIVVAAYGQFIGKQIREAAKVNIVNIHASLLPRWRGAAPINYAIMNGDKESGVSIMKVTKTLDGGEVYKSAEVKIDNMNYDKLYETLANMGSELIIEYLKDEENWLNGIAQDENLVSYAPMLDRKINIIDFNKTSVEVVNLIKAMSKKPGAISSYDDIQFKILDAEIVDNDENFDVGTIVKAEDDEILVATKDSIIRILELQFPGKKAMDAKTFLLGNKLIVGKKLGQ